MNSLRVPFALTFLILSVTLLGCRSSRKPRVAFVSNNPEAFWTIAEAGANKAAEEYGVDVLFRKPSRGDVDAQKEVIDTVLGQGIKAIAISVIEPKQQAAYLDEVASRAKLLTVDNDAPTTQRLAYIGTDNYAAGRALGKLVKEALGEEGGKVVIFVGDQGPLNARQRRQGVIDEIAGRPAPKDVTDFKSTPDGQTFGKYQLHTTTYTDQPEGIQKARENAVDAITKLAREPKVCMVGLWAYNPPQIRGAVLDALKKGQIKKGQFTIAGFDEDYGTLDGIADGTIYATVVQDPYNFGYESVKAMAAIAKGETPDLPANKLKFIPHRIIAREAGQANGLKRLAVADFRDQLDRLLGKK